MGVVEDISASDGMKQAPPEASCLINLSVRSRSHKLV